MPITIDDPNFSVYRLVERIEEQSATMSHRQTMSLISKEIENSTLVDGVRSRIFASFQKLSRFLPLVPRYEQMAGLAESIYVFGIPDVEPPLIPNVHYVYLDANDQLAKEWFLVSFCKDYASALATEELTHMDDPDHTRVFKGVWTFDVGLTAILEEWLSSTVGARPLLIEEEDINMSKQGQLVNNIVNRMLLNVMVDTRPDRAAIIQGEVRGIIKDNLFPLIEQKSHEQQYGTREQEVVILFSDIRDFTGLTQKIKPRDLVERVLNPYLSTVSEVVYQHGGMVDKFLGDGVLAVFGLDAPGQDDANNALAAAKEMLQRLKHYPDMPPVGVGLACGTVLVGEIGSKLRHEDTVIGDAVNTAQRLSQYGSGDIWLSDSIYRMLTQRSHVHPEGRITLKGKAGEEPVFRVTPA